jgi:hypothetical protein
LKNLYSVSLSRFSALSILAGEGLTSGALAIIKRSALRS